MSGYGQAVFNQRHGARDEVDLARDRIADLEADVQGWLQHEEAHASSIDALGLAVAKKLGVTVAFALVLLFAYATFVVFQAGSTAASTVFGLLVLVTAYSFLNTAFGIGPVNVGQWVTDRLTPHISRWLRGRLEPSRPDRD